MGAVDISYGALAVCFLLLLFPVLVSLYLKLNILTPVSVSVVRMTVQLLLIGIFLKYIFHLNSSLLNFFWVVVMIFFATLSTMKNSNLNIKLFIGPVFFSIATATIGILFFFNFAVVRLDNVFEAKYLVAIGGMLLGNSLRSNIIALSNFYKNVKRNENRHIYRLAAGGELFESITSYFRDALLSAFSPIIATMATTGIVSLPGMMTGQILGGSSPVVAVKYQIAIMLAIFSCMTISSFLSVYLSLRVGFNEHGLLKKNVFISS